ncbi:osmotically-inducible protein OsmY [Neorhizobium galegae]|uniref:BON domain-containing protein n=1 Tax=Neorhizobium galegae TaxID=399 RepID=UPI001AEA4938|nr:BON domain-containing protein [Neorhizobium galegae]MBP2562436.1 osmotically-inducible protein OsmY [Neorhizobium galegae]
MSDLLIRQDVLTELEFEPSVNAANIGVAVENGVATLTGHVESYVEKAVAEAAARRVTGVRAIAEHIEVRYPERKKRADDEIAARALDIISWDTALPDGAIDVKVERGCVTLSGEVRWHFQRLAAEAAVNKLGGVTEVRNLLTIRPTAQVPDIKGRIERALARNAEVEAEAIRVAVSGHTVTLEGTVHGVKERQVAEYAAWSAPSVTAVDNRLTVA